VAVAVVEGPHAHMKHTGTLARHAAVIA
jgi:hypothetical protein